MSRESAEPEDDNLQRALGGETRREAVVQSRQPRRERQVHSGAFQRHRRARHEDEREHQVIERAMVHDVVQILTNRMVRRKAQTRPVRELLPAIPTPRDEASNRAERRLTRTDHGLQTFQTGTPVGRHRAARRAGDAAVHAGGHGGHRAGRETAPGRRRAAARVVRIETRRIVPLRGHLENGGLLFLVGGVLVLVFVSLDGFVAVGANGAGEILSSLRESSCLHDESLRRPRRPLPRIRIHPSSASGSIGGFHLFIARTRNRRHRRDGDHCVVHPERRVVHPRRL